MKSKILFTLLALLFAVSAAYAQQRLSPSDPRFNFKDGVYFTLQNYKENTPGALFNQFTGKNGKPLFDFDLSNTLHYKDSGSSEPRSIRSEDIFGYAEKGDFYIKLNYNGSLYFPRLVVIGSLSHFVCEVRTNSYGGGINGMGNMVTYNLLQFLFDYETGKIYQFEQDTFLPLLQRDEELYTEYLALPKKKKRDLMFLYLRKYNERHGVDFPG